MHFYAIPSLTENEFMDTLYKFTPPHIQLTTHFGPDQVAIKVSPEHLNLKVSGYVVAVSEGLVDTFLNRLHSAHRLIRQLQARNVLNLLLSQPFTNLNYMSGNPPYYLANLKLDLQDLGICMEYMFPGPIYSHGRYLISVQDNSQVDFLNFITFNRLPIIPAAEHHYEDVILRYENTRTMVNILDD